MSVTEERWRLRFHINNSFGSDSQSPSRSYKHHGLMYDNPAIVMHVGDRGFMILSNGSYRRSSSTSIKDDAFYYDKPPSQTLNLSIIKLDASYFRIEVSNEATVAELKQAVEDIFAHVPLKGAGKILWPLVWRQFCLSYQGHKLVTETDYLRDYGIKDGDQLHFVRHISDTDSYNKQSKKRDFNLKNKRMRSSHQLNIYQRTEHNDDEDDIGLNGIVIENGNIQNYNAEEIRGGKSWLSGFLGGLFSHSRLPVVRRHGTEGRICCSMIARFIVGSFKKIRRVLRYWRRQHYSRRPTWREF